MYTKIAWWLIALGLLAFGFSGGSTKSPGDLVSIPFDQIDKEGCTSFALDGSESDCEASYTFAERFDAVYLSRFTCRTDSECEEAFGEYEDEYKSPIDAD